MKSKEEMTQQFLEVFEFLIVKLQEVDQACLQLTKNENITKQELSLIGFIGRTGEVIMREIAEYLEVPYSTATGIIDKLTQKKLLKRVNSESDRRTVKVCLTPKKGKELFEKFSELRYQLGVRLLKLLDEKDLEDMDRIMNKMIQQIPNRVLGDMVELE